MARSWLIKRNASIVRRHVQFIRSVLVTLEEDDVPVVRNLEDPEDTVLFLPCSV